MASASEAWMNNAAVEIALKTTFFAVGVIAALIAFIWARRSHRNRLFARRDRRAYEIRKNWKAIVSMELPPETWRNDPMDREIVETILLSQIDIASEDEVEPLLRCFRDSGLLDLRMNEALRARGWKRQSALSALGRTRDPEAIRILAEALHSDQPREVVAAVRSLGRVGVPAAATPILERLADGGLKVPSVVLRTSLVNCCRHDPALLLKFYDGAPIEIREVLARSVAELMSPSIAQELWHLAQDTSAEVRASVARALGDAEPRHGAAVLSVLVSDKTWFVRLRAVTALAGFKDPSTIDQFLRAICDSNRLVRQRAAMALAQFDSEAVAILRDLVSIADIYALHSYVSELQRVGKFQAVIESLDRTEIIDRRQLLGSLQKTQRDLSLRMELTQPDEVDA
jgi:HEAT repeat protein